MATFPHHIFQQQVTERRESSIQPETLAVGLLVASGVLHLGFLPQALHHASFEGILYGSNVLPSFICALDIKRYSRIFGWFGGAAICVASLLAHLFSLIPGVATGIAKFPFSLQGIELFGWILVVLQSLFLLLFVREIVLTDEED